MLLVDFSILFVCFYTRGSSYKLFVLFDHQIQRKIFLIQWRKIKKIQTNVQFIFRSNDLMFFQSPKISHLLTLVLNMFEYCKHA